ncbi:hypothetical protein HZU40_11785 [Mycolicibacterium fluoranthenivorans]|uniref:Uncharacterized protein n=1 Tax=Mycolicibacterium fluoranthenivorans TaxID=258505 RepID=A0A7G8PKK0_9MYCO|nr:hypothetical protein [Mycolicibacterium fluoranthenivorans]QNJ94866.1 hypothetical protein HZU40_11785 [Mycolicibacterium fluoranthenivorans]
MTGGPQFEQGATSPAPVRGAQRRRGHRGVWVLVAAIVTVTASAVAVVLWKAGENDGHGGEAGVGAPGAVSGDYEQWVAAVCAPGSLLQSSAPQFLGALDSASCAAVATPAGTAPVALTILTWPTPVDVADRMAHFPATHVYAVATVNDRSTVFTALDSTERSVLEPLTRFGFMIIALP